MKFKNNNNSIMISKTLFFKGNYKSNKIKLRIQRRLIIIKDIKKKYNKEEIKFKKKNKIIILQEQQDFLQYFSQE